MKRTDLSTPDHFHKVVDCQWACPAHTPVPQYIRLIAEGRYADAYMVNWRANVFPGILGRTCDRPCEPACRRGRVEKEPVAICRLKRAAADYKGNIRALLPEPASRTNGKRIALVGAGPASLTVARDLAPLGYRCVILDQDPKAGGMMRTRIPRFRVPEGVIDEETGYVLDLGVELRSGTRVNSLKALLDEGWDSVFIGAGAPRGLDLELPGRAEASAHVHVGVEWLANIWFQHIRQVGKRVVVIGGGNTAMDCGRSARRLGGEHVSVIVREDDEDMTAASWEKEALLREGVTISNNLAPKAFTHENGRLTGVLFEPVKAINEDGRWIVSPTGGPTQHVPCDDVVVAIGQEPAFSWIERDLGIAFDARDMPKVDPNTLQSTRPGVFFGGDAAFGPKNIITAVAQGHEAAISMDHFLSGGNIEERLAPTTTLVTQYVPTVLRPLPEVSVDARHPVPLRPEAAALADIHAEVELGFDIDEALAEAGRCLHCDIETVFIPPLCVECKACETICPTDCITFTKDGEEAELRGRLKRPATNLGQDLYVANGLVSGRIMVKDEDVCLHCGLCAEHCPTGAWQMRAFGLQMTHAGEAYPATTSGGAAHG
ncbi:FAD-dependent oxidoreductase [Hyphomicrobium sp. CS1BSMeth3]|jgi:formate dehydrogenase beta subunit|uniref:FAD-dependent oxidoreductase n=1 Tax=Hyphomicrobium sp. CS1BSMeth3 TaxID=1892844 RepID=UPI000931E1D3|nr:FAD-dependent oxidoreductase [Hyphomicrobium sp. CS1BSMeth3]